MKKKEKCFLLYHCVLPSPTDNINREFAKQLKSDGLKSFQQFMIYYVAVEKFISKGLLVHQHEKTDVLVPVSLSLCVISIPESNLPLIGSFT